MSYKRKTNFYRIPVMGMGDKMTESNNIQQWSIVDNLLYAATFGCQQCFLQQGEYELINKGQLYELKIKPINNGFSLMGIIDYRLFFSKNTLTVNALSFGYRYYIYLQATDGIDTNPEAFYINAYTYKLMDTKRSFLLCIVEINDDPKVITDINKVYAKNLLSHTKDNTNPHGKQMYQYNFNVINELKLKNENIYASIYTSYITTDKEYELSFPDGKQVIYVSAYPESIKAGCIAWKIENRKIILSNSGQTGIKVNLKLDVR